MTGIDGTTTGQSHFETDGNAIFGGNVTSIGQFTVLNDAPQVVIKSTDTSDGDATLSLIADNGATNEDYWKIKAVASVKDALKRDEPFACPLVPLLPSFLTIKIAPSVL